MRLRHDGNPSIWPACAAFAFLFLVPKILEKFVFSSTKLSTLTFSEPSVNAVDVVRAIAIWYSTFASFQSFSTQKFTARITGRDTKSKICVADFIFESGPNSKNHALDLTPRTQVYFHLAWQTAFICLERFGFETTNTTCLRNTVFRNRNMYIELYTSHKNAVLFCDLVGLFKCFSGWTQGCSERAKRSSSTLAVMFSRHPYFWELWERAEHLCRPALFFRVFRGLFCVRLQGLYGVVTVYLVLSCTLKAIWSCEIFYKDMNPKYSANPCDLLMCLWSIRAVEEWICWSRICRFSSVSVDYFFIRWFFANVLQASPTESEPSISGAALRWSLDANFVLYLITHELYQQKFHDPLKVLASFSAKILGS